MQGKDPENLLGSLGMKELEKHYSTGEGTGEFQVLHVWSAKGTKYVVVEVSEPKRHMDFLRMYMEVDKAVILDDNTIYL